MHNRGDRQRERRECRDDERLSREATPAAGSNVDNMDEDLPRLDENLVAASLPETGAVPFLPTTAHYEFETPDVTAITKTMLEPTCL